MSRAVGSTGLAALLTALDRLGTSVTPKDFLQSKAIEDH